MQCPDCLGYRHEGACPPDDHESPSVSHETIAPDFPLSCPFCGSDPGLVGTYAAGDLTWHQVGCEEDECAVNPQVSGYSLAEAWGRWDKRAATVPDPEPTDLELAGAGGIK